MCLIRYILAKDILYIVTYNGAEMSASKNFCAAFLIFICIVWAWYMISCRRVCGQCLCVCLYVCVISSLVSYTVIVT